MPLRWLSKPAPALAPLTEEAPAYVLAAPGTAVTPRRRLSQALAASSLLAVAAQPYRAPLPLRPRPRPAATTFNVTNLNPTGAGSLRQAIRAANANPGPDTITFLPGLTGTIPLTGTLRVTDTVQIVGPGPGQLSVSGSSAFTVFYLVEPGSLLITTTISGLTIRDGLGTGNAAGGIYSVGADLMLDQVDLIHNTGGARGGAVGFATSAQHAGLSLRNSLVSGNIGQAGGGIDVKNDPGAVVVQNTRFVSNTATSAYGGGAAYLYGVGSVLIEDSSFMSNTASLGHGGGLKLGNTQGGATIVRRSTISGNSALYGGGIAFYRPAYDTLIEDTTISGNSGGNRGGGVDAYNNYGGTHTVRRTTISGNTAARGGGVYVGELNNYSLTIVDSTISGNQAASKGGGIYVEKRPIATLQNSTVVSNSAGLAGGGIWVNSGDLPITDTIIALNHAPANPDITGTFELRYDLVQITGTAAITNAGGNLFGLDPQLGPLANNGGLTLTHLPRHTSPAVNAGDPAFAAPPDTDQRGGPRVLGGRLDMGAVEIAELFLPLVER